MTNSVDPDQAAPIGAVCSGSTLFASILNLSVMLGNYLQQMTSADDIFRCIFFLVLLGLTLLGSCTCRYAKSHILHLALFEFQMFLLYIFSVPGYQQYGYRQP